MHDVYLDKDHRPDEFSYPRNMIIKSVTGDSSDNIPQVASGVGYAFALALSDSLVNHCGSEVNFDSWKSRLTDYISGDYDGIDKKPRGWESKSRKVLDNWDQFLLNWKLMDLREVPEPPDVISYFTNSIQASVGNSDYFKSRELFSKYEINELSVDQFIIITSSYNIR